ncbi:YcaO-like family protein [Pararhizobium sp. LjRoot238]|uniref:YcaO-like family protein n=1 Tax=Pararhizobium sp. LjRoot238 TaxID=3342293 RepID=UPI003ECD078D
MFEHLEREASYADLSTSLESVRLEPEFLASGLADSFFDNKLSDNNKFFGCMFYSHRHARGVNIPLYAKPTKQGNTEIIFPISSSGCASHVNDRLAKQSSILEVVERDAFFTSWYGNISSKCCNNIAIVEDIFENTPFDNWNSIKIYRLPTNFNCYVYATVLINNSDGFLIGLGAALDNDTALRKSSMEALYFFNWLNIFGQKSSTVSHFPVINDFDDHLYFFWFCGKQSYSQLECGGEFLFNDYERNFSYHDLISSINADHYLFYRKLKTNCSVSTLFTDRLFLIP